MPSRQKQFPELVTIRTPVNARADLQVYSITQTDLAIAGVNLSAYTPLTTTQSISGSFNTRIGTLESQTVAMSGVNTTQTNLINSLSSEVAGISGDIYDLDLSLTTLIDTLFNTTSTSVSAGSYTVPTSAVGFITVNVNGSPFKLAYYNN
jgi:hypothetical protein